MADTNNTPVDRIRIFNADGFPVAEFRATVQRSWLIGAEGRALFNVPSRKTNIVNETVLAFGNWLVVESTALPPWVGVIDFPRRWSSRQVTVHAYTSERVFSWRRGPIEQILTGSAGTIFEQLLAFVNQAQRTVIKPRIIWRGGVQRQETVNPTKLDEDLQRLQERSGEEYRFVPSVENGRLVVYADWLQSLGIDTTGQAILHEGKGGGNIEMTNNVLVEDGPVVNDLLAYGDGETWNSRPTQRVVDPGSVGKFQLRQDSQGYSGVTELATLYANGKQYVDVAKNPVRTFELNALNVGNTFLHLRLGNRLKLRLENVGFYMGRQGFETMIRIIGMAYDPNEKNQVNLVVDEVV